MSTRATAPPHTQRALGPFEAVRELTYDAPFPQLLRVQQHVEMPALGDVGAAVAASLAPLRDSIRPGMTVAVTAGSRGIVDLPAVIKAAVRWLRDASAEPFIVPAMGSHGGATAAGQRAVLAHLGITEEAVGAPIRATMDTVELGRIDDGPAVHLDANAAAADGIVVINRVKAHTDFHADVESGLAKITAIGLGKQRGAEGIHAYGSGHLGHWAPLVAQRIVAAGKILGGLALVENAAHRAARVAFVAPEQIGGPAEAELLAESKRLMNRLPFDDIDVLIVDELGKDKSGSGLDTNIIGRMRIFGVGEFDRPRIATIVVLDISEASQGNAVGMGLADFVPLRLVEKVDLRSVYINAITSGIGGPQRAQIPITLPTDRDAIAAAILCCGRADPANARVVRVRSTLELLELDVSESLRDEVERRPDLEAVGKPRPMEFGADGALAPF